MDFSLNEEQQATRELAARILGDLQTPERHKELEAAGEWFDRKAWSALAEAGLCGLAVPEGLGGAGLGFLELALVLEEVGRTTAKVPYLASMVLAALPVAEFGTEEQQAAWLPVLAAGETVGTAALVEPQRNLLEPATRARPDGEAWILDGHKQFVPAGLDAGLVLVSAAAEGGVVVAVVDPATDGVTVERQDTTTGIPEARLTFDGARSLGALGSPADGTAVVAWILLRARAALAATAVGVCDAALRMTAEYTKTREQFGRPIATFQAVGQRAADAYIDTEAIRLTALQAAWRISEGLPADEEVAIAKFWAAEGGQRVVHAAQHLHGGVGVDRDYPLHRYFLWAKSIELTFGGATSQLLALGDALADRPV